MWQIGIAKMTKPGKYLFVGPGQDIPADAEKEGYIVVQSTTNNILPGIRLMSEDPAKRLEMLKKIEIYPYSERATPKPRGFIRPGGQRMDGRSPPRHGILGTAGRYDYPVNLLPNVTGFSWPCSRPLGIEKGKPFKTTSEQTAILTEAALVGEAMTKADAFGNPRLLDGHYMDGSNWTFPATSPSDQRREFYDALDGRAAWFYEAVTNDVAMHGHITGKGQVYMGAYRDQDGDPLDGGRDYVLHLPADVPAETFWSLTAYESEDPYTPEQQVRNCRPFIPHGSADQ